MSMSMSISTSFSILKVEQPLFDNTTPQYNSFLGRTSPVTWAWQTFSTIRIYKDEKPLDM